MGESKVSRFVALVVYLHRWPTRRRGALGGVFANLDTKRSPRL